MTKASTAKWMIIGIELILYGFIWAQMKWLGFPLGFIGSAVTVGTGLAIIIITLGERWI